MKKIVGLLFTLASLTISAQQSKFANVYSFIENTAVFEINQTEGHTVCIPLRSVGEALNLQKSKSENVLLLNNVPKHFLRVQTFWQPLRCFSELETDETQHKLFCRSSRKNIVF